MHGLILVLLLNGWAIPQRIERDDPPSGSARADAPVVTRTLGSEATLREDIDQLIRNAGLRGADWGVMIVSLTNGDTLYALEPDRAMSPASNAKLFTTAAALYYLGAQFRMSTFLMAAGPVDDGVLAGDLVIYGTGDPTFSARYGGATAVFDAFADTLEARGIRAIGGDVVGDASYFRGPGAAEGWQTNYIDASYAAPASALSFAENLATLRIQPGATGGPPTVTLVPGGEGIEILNEATTTASGRVSIQAMRRAYEAPLVVVGRIPRASRGVTRTLPVSDPAGYAAAAFREILTQRGIVVRGTSRSVQRVQDSPVTGRSVFAPAFDRASPLRVLALHHSPALLEILTTVNKRSHNLFAEQTFRAVGRVATGDGSVEGGAQAVQNLIARETGIDTTQVRLYDGSGLSVLNRVSARAVIHLLGYMARSPMWEAYRTTLPEAGAPDGLRRMQRTRADRNLVAKTGTLSGVSALSGYVRAANGELLAFSILSNDVASTWRAKRVEDGIGVRLANFTRGDPGPPLR